MNGNIIGFVEELTKLEVEEFYSYKLYLVRSVWFFIAQVFKATLWSHVDLSRSPVYGSIKTSNSYCSTIFKSIIL